MTTSGCPTPQQLAALLSGRLPPDVEQSLAAHLDGCERCRQWLERLASDPRFLAEAAENLRGTSVETVPLPPAELVAKWADLNDATFDSGTKDAARGETPRRQAGRETAVAAAVAPSNASGTRAFYPEPAPGEFPRPGQRLGVYELEKEVGRGGMGVVFLARDTSLERPVAIKVLGQNWIRDDVARQRFLSEARAAAAVNHRNVVTIYAVVESGEWPHLAMEYVPGETLQHLIDAHAPLPLASVLSIGQRVAAGLAAAHAKGLVHRDVKPGNILVVPRTGVVKLTDFGLARGASDARITKDGLIVGTPAFMAPEQISGESLDARADLYSFGGVLHAMCTGRPPIEAEHTIALIRRVLDAPRTPLAETCPHLPAAFAQLVDRLLERRPADRFQSAQEVVEALRRLRGERGEETTERGTTGPETLLAADERESRTAPREVASDEATIAVARSTPIDTAIVAPPTTSPATAAPPMPPLVPPVAPPVLAPPLPPRAKPRRAAHSWTSTVLWSLAIFLLLAGLAAYGLGEWLHATGGAKTVAPDPAGVVARPSGPNGANLGGSPGARPRREPAAAVERRSDVNGSFIEILEAGPDRRRHATLADAVRAALAGETLVVHGSGLLTSEPIVIPQKALSIRAAPGDQPVVQFLPANAQGGFMIDADAPLLLEGLTLLVIGSNNFGGPGPGRIGGSIPGQGLIAFRNTTLTLRRCRLAAWRRGPAVTLDRVQSCEITDCQLSGGETSSVILRALTSEAGRETSLRIDSTLITGAAGVTFDVHPDAAWSFETRRTDYVSEEALRIELPNSNPPAVGQPRGRVVVEQCMFGGPFLLGVWTHATNEPPLARADMARRLPSLVRWESRGNTFAEGLDFLSVRSLLRTNPPPRSQLAVDLEAWRSFWGADETDSRETRIVYGPDRLSRDEALRRAKRRDAGADFITIQLREAELPDEHLVRPAR